MHSYLTVCKALILHTPNSKHKKPTLCVHYIGIENRFAHTFRKIVYATRTRRCNKTRSCSENPYFAYLLRNVLLINRISSTYSLINIILQNIARKNKNPKLIYIRNKINKINIFVTFVMCLSCKNINHYAGTIILRRKRFMNIIFKIIE